MGMGWGLSFLINPCPQDEYDQKRQVQDFGKQKRMIGLPVGHLDCTVDSTTFQQHFKLQKKIPILVTSTMAPHDNPDPFLVLNEPHKCKLTAHVTSEENASAGKKETTKQSKLTGIWFFL